MDKLANKLMENKWFIRGLALVLALLLYITAYIDENARNPSQASTTQSATIEDVPIEVYYDEENYVVYNVPETATVHIAGNNALVQSTKTLRDFTVFIDLMNVTEGTHRVELQIRGISERLSVRIEPQFVTVIVQEKETVEFPVDVEFNEALLEEGYKIGDIQVEPQVVKVTGGKDVISQVSLVKAVIEVEAPVNETIKQKAFVTVLDKNLNKLDVLVDPGEVQVTIPIIPPSKTVPVEVKVAGEPPEGIILQAINTNIQEVEIYGKKNVLEEISKIEIPVDIRDIQESTVLSVPTPLPRGVTAISHETIDVEIVVARGMTRTLEGIPIQIIGLKEGYTVEIKDPENGEVDLTISGISETIESLNSTNFTLTVDITNLTPGEHEVEIKVDGPEDVEWELSQRTVVVLIEEVNEE
ncbi:MAG: CdaR family protein [Caldibacillus sp.]